MERQWWSSNIINAIYDEKLETLVIDRATIKTGMRLSTLANRRGCQGQEKDFETIKMKAGTGLRTVIVAAASRTVPADKISEKKQYRGHAQVWFKTAVGGRELAGKCLVSTDGRR